MNVQKSSIVFVLIFIAAAYLRLSALDYETLGPSEVEFFQAANDYAKGNILRSFYIFDTPPLIKYFGAFALLVAGFSEVALRLVSVIFGMMTIILTYFFAKKFYSKKTGILAATLVAFSFIHLQFSRYFTYETQTGFFFLLALYYFFDAVENRKKNYLFLGAAVALGMLTRFIMVYAIIIIIIIAIFYRYIQVRRKPQFSIIIDNFLVKALIVGVVLFFLVWPHALLPMETEITISVDFADGPHVNRITTSVPQLFLALGKRSVVTGAEGFMSLPLGYFLFFAIKENMVFIGLFLIGLLSLISVRKSIDKLVLISLVVFLLLVWLQHAGFSYRYMTIIIPLVAVIAAQWIDRISGKRALLAIGIIALASGALALVAHPAYIFHTNVGYPDPEIYQAEGMKESIAFMKESCPAVYANSYYQFIIEPYYQGSTKHANQTVIPTCVLVGYADLIGSSSENTMVRNFVEVHSCELVKTVKKQEIVLQQIYYCD